MQNHLPVIQHQHYIGSLTPEQKVLAGVSEDLVRISVGIEHIDDIIQDVEQAIEASKK